MEVGETEIDENCEVFYYFIESNNNPENDPLWLTGDLGCYAFFCHSFEIGIFFLYFKSLIKLCHIFNYKIFIKKINIIWGDIWFGTFDTT